MFMSRFEKLGHIEETKTARVENNEEIESFTCPSCGTSYDDDPNTALSCCPDDCYEDLEEMRADRRYDAETGN